MFSIKAVSQTTGVSIETLRAWERRYRIVVPRRDANGRRSYAPEDVIRLRKLREATERGHAISKLARYSDEEIGKLLAEPGGRSGEATAASRSFAEQMLTAAMNYRPDECDHALSMALALLPLRSVVTSVLSPVMIDIGERWHAGQATIAQERILSTTIRKQVSAVVDTYNRIATGPTIVLTTVSGERHEIGLLMGALVASSRGVRCQYLGPDVPGADIAVFADRVGASAVALSFVNREALPTTLPELSTVARGLPAHIELWVGGSAIRTVPVQELPSRALPLADIAAFESQIDLLVGAGGRS